MKITAEPRSDQWNADDFVGGPRVFTIAGVKVGTADQKYDIELVEGEGRSWRPPLTMLRLMIAAWGDESSQWKGRRVQLYRDDAVRFGSDAVGGIRISHMSHLPGNKKFSAMLTSTRGRRTRVTVDPLPDVAASQPAASQPKPDGQLTPAQRAMGLGMLTELFTEGGIAGDNRDDWAIVANAVLGQPVASPDALTDPQLKSLGNTLKQWKESGELDKRITDVLNQHSIDQDDESAK